MTGGDEDSSTGVTPLRRTACALLLALFAFVQEPGRIVADTKFDLMVDPGRFLGRATEMWDGSAAFGQIQNQAYGYFFPMGPFFWLGEQLGFDAWVTQRLWWTLLLVLAFFGVLKVAETLAIGKPWTRVAAAFAYALSVHVTTIIGASSVEAWPTALVPWVLWAVMRGTNDGSPRRWAAVAGLFTAACGGVNAVAVAVVLPLGACWILTRERGSRRWVFFGWWVGATLLATLWWLVPLFLMGGYSFPFLDYIENATVTTGPTGLGDVLGGTSVWVAYLDPATYGAGGDLALTAFLLVDAALIAGLGLAGLARRDTPHRQFLLCGLFVGVLLLSLGYTGAASGWFADGRQDLLDGVLAPLRNLHKFDAVLRLPLVLGLAHLLGVLMPAWERSTWSVRLWPGVATLALVGLASPWFIPDVAPAGSMGAVPDYWTKVAAHLEAQDDRGRTLVVPAAAFGTYQWGSPRDDVLQPLMSSPWAVRNVVPLAQPGNVALLDAVTREIESGRPSERLAAVLRANGISRLVVRNDLDRTTASAPDPVVVDQALRGSPGLRPVASFGPQLGWAPVLDVDGQRVVPFGGLADTYPAVEIFEVADARGPVSLLPRSEVPVVAGGPGSALATSLVPGAFLLASDAEAPLDGFVLTDTMRRREKAFSAVRHNESATLRAGQPWRLSGPEHFHRTSADQERWQGVTRWQGVDSVTASSSQAWADAVPPLERGAHPGAALDDDLSTAWRTARGTPTLEQWWQVDFGRQVDLDRLTFTVGEDTWTQRLRFSNGRSHVDVDIEDPGEPQEVRLDLGPSTSLRASALETAPGAERSQLTLSEVSVPGISARRFLRLRGDVGEEVTGISLNRDPDTAGCFTTSESQVCRDQWASDGEDGDVMARQLDLPAASSYDIALAGSARAGSRAVQEVVGQLPASVSTSSTQSSDLRASALALVDGDRRTTWVADGEDETPEIAVAWSSARTISHLRLRTGDAAPASHPARVKVTAGGESRTVELDDRGRATFRALRGRRVTVQLLGSRPTYDSTVSPNTQLPVGVGELSLRSSPGGPELVAVAGREVTLPCGQGPSLDVNGRSVPTSVSTTVPDLLAGDVQVRSCRKAVDLDEGTNTIVAEPTDAFRLDGIDLRPAGSAVTTVEPEVPVVTSWTDSERRLEVAGSPDQRLLVVAENFNAGWEARLDGELLETRRVGGWQQGWVVPAGAAGEVTLRFAPQSLFTAGLVAGGVALLGLLALAFFPVRRARERAATSRETSAPVAWLVLLPVAGLVAGWAGFGLAVLGVLGHRLLPRRLLPRRGWSLSTSLVCAVLVTSAGLWTAWERSRVESLTTSTVTQLLLVFAFVVATLGAGAKGPAFFRRSRGRSTV